MYKRIRLAISRAQSTTVVHGVRVTSGYNGKDVPKGFDVRGEGVKICDGEAGDRSVRTPMQAEDAVV